MINLNGIPPREANKAKAPENSFGTKMRGKHLFISEAVLQREDPCLLAQKRRQQIRNCGIRSRFQRNDHPVANPDVIRGFSQPGIFQMV